MLGLFLTGREAVRGGEGDRKHNLNIEDRSFPETPNNPGLETSGPEVRPGQTGSADRPPDKEDAMRDPIDEENEDEGIEEQDTDTEETPEGTETPEDTEDADETPEPAKAKPAKPAKPAKKASNRMSEDELREDYPHVVLGSLIFIESENKQAVTISCTSEGCEGTRQVRTSDLWQVDKCEACTRKDRRERARDRRRDKKAEAKASAPAEAEVAEVEVEVAEADTPSEEAGD